MLLYCFQCHCTARSSNDFHNCMIDDVKEHCGSAVADFYFDANSVGLRRRLAAINCTLISNLLTVYTLTAVFSLWIMHVCCVIFNNKVWVWVGLQPTWAVTAWFESIRIDQWSSLPAEVNILMWAGVQYPLHWPIATEIDTHWRLPIAACCLTGF